MLLVFFVCFAKEERRKIQRVRGQMDDVWEKDQRRDERLNGTRSTRKFASQGFGQSDGGMGGGRGGQIAKVRFGEYGRVGVGAIKENAAAFAP